MNIIQKRLKTALVDTRANVAAVRSTAAARTRPGQPRTHLRQVPQGGNAFTYLAQYAVSPWVYIAVHKLAQTAARARLDVVDRDDPVKLSNNHGLLTLFGSNGRPNEYQSVFEFWEEALSFLELAGNMYLYWYSDSGYEPTACYVLNPARVRVLPGTDRVVEGYEYWFEGMRYPLSWREVTHLKRFNPANEYYGMPAIEAILVDITGDQAMAEWNVDFFGDGVAVPAGIFVIDPNTDDAERDRISDELNAKYSKRRKTAVAKVAAGSSAFFDAGLKQRDMDFIEGRMMNRRVIYEALDLPLGLMSEASTEAHARVAERQLYEAVYGRTFRIESKFNAEVMQFWPGWNRWLSRFEDLRAKNADWEQESRKVDTLLKYLTRNEVRAMHGHAAESEAGVTNTAE